ncbi:tRNA uridine-5-carboxymethylaminomethyl(34) synthesis GTPase MnmE [Gluconacetobacter entanii]|uniref:tRNA uridine-5-carboxymethylaminomethyl(34) synthesis GTPase MnmE n=1 Tax=Gluconacetobacter entanii TaxID=108528 RepID=UPI001C932FCE|nr:tRNA uridine-5-carboxymethylaminomethyl(34) synthesis GTPase MnmE [Gluconacetobacter entanii]MBY4641684.1 tRNA uridine-5-carboxymethylaminomethyl(34) synthesis GTPase MnmE [Gluconacetobacter entanii]MCW4580603.1 tRNA uridine-5-carboxymethylaminomethyl(34) synthesis GTPase MnmE [Gluconacetobacter entanii]MCW4583890.1 tRNA uridine-5-carboxymethylaminomethyl(34) synthesis GTPase MnmE [Gluconacetobacter entanii]MCW4587235.1 tRNA uridine-5-carboxymethylaminomethyl(34) synthesis GTPase MnmE [Gluco
MTVATEVPAGRHGDGAAPVIFALATGAGRAAIAVMRISGAGSDAILRSLCGGLPEPRRASLRGIWRRDADGGQGVLLDRAVALWFPGPNSYTGEDSAELHLHAGPAVISGVADALVALGARPAEPGEFTRRAFASGRLDLVQAEGIADLIDAETEAQRRQALAQADGAQSRLYEDWAARLRTALAHQEALIDFPDEDLPPEVEDELLGTIAGLRDEMQAYLDDGSQGERLRRGLVFAIVGEPNVGKSSLLNALAQRDAAIVSSRAGTTRDAIEVRVVLGDAPVTLVDTAGLRETEDEIEAEGVRRALFHVKQADCVIHVFSGAAVPDKVGPDSIMVCNKIDEVAAPPGITGISVRSGEGMETLRDVLAQRARDLTQGRAAAPLTRARHRAAIEETARHLTRAADDAWPEVRGEEMRLAMRALGRLTGAVDVEALLDTVFGQFCIGK